MSKISSVYKLSLEKVSKKYGQVTALAAVDLQVRSGEFVTLLGPSGSGKSTLLKIVAGMTRASTGRIIIDSRDATDMPARERDLGMVFQNYALMPHMSVFENVAFPLRVRRIPLNEIKRKVADALGIVQLDHLAGRRPAELSGGQQQRVAIARAIVYNPSLVLMDEPLGALDKRLREQLQVEIRQLHKKLNITVLYVTHDQQEAMSMSDRVVLMNKGDIEQVAPPQELYFSPQTVFAADFLGNSNFMEAIAVQQCGQVMKFQLDSGESVFAPVRVPLATGTKVRLMVRPEHVQPERVIEPDGRKESNEQWNLIHGNAADAVFLGESVQLRVARKSSPDLSAIISNEQGGQDFATGVDIVVRWKPEHTIVFTE